MHIVVDTLISLMALHLFVLPLRDRTAQNSPEMTAKMRALVMRNFWSAFMAIASTFANIFGQVAFQTGRKYPVVFWICESIDVLLVSWGLVLWG